jgi:hypothetical protein
VCERVGGCLALCVAAAAVAAVLQTRQTEQKRRSTLPTVSLPPRTGPASCTQQQATACFCVQEAGPTACCLPRHTMAAVTGFGTRTGPWAPPCCHPWSRQCWEVTARSPAGSPWPLKGYETVTHMPTGPSRPQRHAHWAHACGFSSLRRRQPGGAMSAFRLRACLLFYRCVGCYQQNRLHHRASEMNVVHVVSRAACLVLPMCAGRAHVTRVNV